MRLAAVIALAALAAFAALAACSKSESPKAVPQPSIDARRLQDYPPSARASIVMTGRDRWPCAFRVSEDQGIRADGRSVYAYGERTTCHLPLSLIVQGIWGCPESFVRTDSDGMVRTRTLEYDDTGHLLVFEGHTRSRFTWDGDRLAATTREQFGIADTATYVDRGDEVVAVNAGKPQEVLRFEGDRLVRLDEYVFGRLGAEASVAWVDGRPQSVSVRALGPVAGSVGRTFIYADCPPSTPNR
jgi:hypothetical protein